jgi:hypothetical protein
MRRVYHWQLGISRRSWKGMHLLKILRRISKSRWIITSEGESDWRLSCISRYLSVNLGMQFVSCTKHLWMKYRDRRVWYELDFRQSTRRNCWSGSYITCIEFITALRNPHIVRNHPRSMKSLIPNPCKLGERYIPYRFSLWSIYFC